MSNSSTPPSIQHEFSTPQGTPLSLYAIELRPPDYFPESLCEPCYVYALVKRDREGGCRASLINAGPYNCGTQLLEKLEEIGVTHRSVERIVATNWDVRNLGNVPLFPNAVVAALSPDRVRPYNLNAILEHERHRLRAILEELYEVRDSGVDFEIPALPEVPSEAMEELEDFFTHYYEALPPMLPFLSLRNESLLNLHGVTFHVFDHSPYHRGQLILFEPESHYLFGLAIPSIGLPKPFYSLAAVTPMVDRIVSMNPSEIATNHGGIEKKPGWLLRRTRSFIKSFTENAPVALRTKPTLLEFVRQNFGYDHDNLIDYLFEIVKFQDLLNELARDEEIAIEGAGIGGRRYGINVVDTRHPRLQK